jgi:cytochrome c oxidase subunit I+III
VTDKAKSKSDRKSSFMPVVIAIGIAVTMLGAVLNIVVFFGGIGILVAGVIKVFSDDAKEKFSVEEDVGEDWPLEKLGKVKLGVWVFIMSEILIFGGLLVAYGYVRVSSPTWPVASQIHAPLIGMINTIILLTSSLSIVLALNSIRNGDKRGLKIGLAATIGLGLAFLVIKLAFEWPELIRSGFTINSGLPASSYYALTGVHAVHLAAGLAAVGYLMFRASIRASKGQFTSTKHSGVENVGLYWHFIDIVWMFLFPLFYLI